MDKIGYNDTQKIAFLPTRKNSNTNVILKISKLEKNFNETTKLIIDRNEHLEKVNNNLKNELTKVQDLYKKLDNNINIITEKLNKYNNEIDLTRSITDNDLNDELNSFESSDIKVPDSFGPPLESQSMENLHFMNLSIDEKMPESQEIKSEKLPAENKSFELLDSIKELEDDISNNSSVKEVLEKMDEDIKEPIKPKRKYTRRKKKNNE